jgi:hypothetical protein
MTRSYQPCGRSLDPRCLVRSALGLSFDVPTAQLCWSHLVQITWEVFAIPRFHRLPSCTSSTDETTPRKCRRAVHAADRPPPGSYLFSRCREPGESCKDLRAASTSSLPGPAPRMWLPCLPVMAVRQLIQSIAYPGLPNRSSHPMTSFARRISYVSYSFIFWGLLSPRDDGVCHAWLINSRLIFAFWSLDWKSSNCE